MYEIAHVINTFEGCMGGLEKSLGLEVYALS